MRTPWQDRNFAPVNGNPPMSKEQMTLAGGVVPTTDAWCGWEGPGLAPPVRRGQEQRKLRGCGCPGIGWAHVIIGQVSAGVVIYNNLKVYNVE